MQLAATSRARYCKKTWTFDKSRFQVLKCLFLRPQSKKKKQQQDRIKAANISGLTKKNDQSQVLNEIFTTKLESSETTCFEFLIQMNLLKIVKRRRLEKNNFLQLDSAGALSWIETHFFFTSC